MSKKYWEFTGEVKIEFGVELKQIRAMCDFGYVSKGELGGWIADAANLTQNGIAWLGENVKAFGGTFCGGTFRGGTFRGGTFWGGTFEGGTFWGGAFEGGTFCGGTFKGGTFRGGTFRGGTFEGGNNDFIVISPIGSEGGQFTAEVTDNGTIICNHGGFEKTLDEFEATVSDTHEDNEFAQEYGLVIQLVEKRLGPVAEKRKAKISAKKEIEG